jgi:hypothetical protein
MTRNLWIHVQAISGVIKRIKDNLEEKGEAIICASFIY